MDATISAERYNLWKLEGVSRTCERRRREREERRSRKGRVKKDGGGRVMVGKMRVRTRMHARVLHVGLCAHLSSYPHITLFEPLDVDSTNYKTAG